MKNDPLDGWYVDGGLYRLSDYYVNYQDGDEDICLDGRFTAKELKALAEYMEEHQ